MGDTDWLWGPLFFLLVSAILGIVAGGVAIGMHAPRSTAELIGLGVALYWFFLLMGHFTDGLVRIKSGSSFLKSIILGPIYGVINTIMWFLKIGVFLALIGFVLWAISQWIR